MRCEDVVEELVHFEVGEVSPEVHVEVRTHVQDCDGCSRELEALRGALSLTRAVTAPPLPEPVRERLWARIEAQRAGAFEALWSVFSPILLGVGTCLVSLYPLHHFGVLDQMERTTLILGGVIWASLYNSVFTTILHHARLRQLLQPPCPSTAGPSPRVSEPEESRGIRIQSVVYGLLVAFTGLFWSAVLVIGPGATRAPTVQTAPAVLGLSIAVLGLVGLGIGVYERSHAYATALLVSALYCALGTPALYMISHGHLAPAETLQGTLSVILICLGGTYVGRRLEASTQGALHPERASAGAVAKSMRDLSRV